MKRKFRQFKSVHAVSSSWSSLPTLSLYLIQLECYSSWFNIMAFSPEKPFLTHEDQTGCCSCFHSILSLPQSQPLIQGSFLYVGLYLLLACKFPWGWDNVQFTTSYTASNTTSVHHRYTINMSRMNTDPECFEQNKTQDCNIKQPSLLEN